VKSAYYINQKMEGDAHEGSGEIEDDDEEFMDALEEEEEEEEEGGENFQTLPPDSVLHSDLFLTLQSILNGATSLEAIIDNSSAPPIPPSSHSVSSELPHVHVHIMPI
jgi:hypothetical protein